MKFYETHFEDYISSVEKYNLHPEIARHYNRFPKKIGDLENMIFYGPTGIGKYSQVLSLLKQYSPSELKYDKKITANTEKQQYNYRISDIHYEIDMSLLGCNSKLLWHEIFFQIVDIISVKPNKLGIIVCKNFHLIHTELLEIFYSYMQQYNQANAMVKIKFIIITEHVSFIPIPILNSCQVINMGRPSKEKYIQMALFSNHSIKKNEKQLSFVKKITDYKTSSIDFNNLKSIMSNIDTDGILNIKEIRSFSLMDGPGEMPKDIFNIICNDIIKEISQKNKISFTAFRDMLYDILTYNLDVSECLWCILKHFIESGLLTTKDISDILRKSYKFLKYYNNNYRPVYHLESIVFTIINKVHKINEL
jgi:hypothetical protein